MVQSASKLECGSCHVYPMAPEKIAVDESITLEIIGGLDDAISEYELLKDDPERLFKIYGTKNYSLEKAIERHDDLKQQATKGQAAPYKLLNYGSRVGTINLFNRRQGRMFMSYWITAEAEGKGVVGRAAAAVVAAAFGPLELGVIDLRIRPTNERSKNLAQRLGGQHIRTIVPYDHSGEREIWEIRKYG